MAELTSTQLLETGDGSAQLERGSSQPAGYSGAA